MGKTIQGAAVFKILFKTKQTHGFTMDEGAKLSNEIIVFYSCFLVLLFVLFVFNLSLQLK